MPSGKLKLDLHPIYNKGDLIDKSLEEVIEKASLKRVREVEIVCGKGSGQLKKKVLRFLNRKDIKEKYKRVKKDFDNFGRIFVYFR